MGANPGSLAQKQTVNVFQKGQMNTQQNQALLLLFYDINANQMQSHHSFRVQSTTTVGEVLKYLQSKVGDYKISIFINNKEFLLTNLHTEIFPYVIQLSERKIGFKVFQNECIKYRDLIERKQMTTLNGSQYSISNPNSLVHNPAEYDQNKNNAQTINNSGTSNSQQQNVSQNQKIKIYSVNTQIQQQQNQMINYSQSSNKQEQAYLDQVDIHQQFYAPKEIDNKSQPSKGLDESQIKNELLRLQQKIKQFEQIQANLESENRTLQVEKQNLLNQITLQDEIIRNLQGEKKQITQIIQQPQENQKKPQIEISKTNLLERTELLSPLVSLDCKCPKTLKRSELQTILTNAINNGSKAFWNHQIKIPYPVCLQAGDVGKVYLNQICQIEQKQIQQGFQTQKRNIGRCTTKVCYFFCIWNEQLEQKQTKGDAFCPLCLSFSVRKVIDK